MAGYKSRWGIAPYFIVDNVIDTANYYRDKLGFKYDRFWGEPEPRFAMVYRNGVVVMLGQLDATGIMRPNSLPTPVMAAAGTLTSGSTTSTRYTKNSNQKASRSPATSAINHTTAATSTSKTATATVCVSARIWNNRPLGYFHEDRYKRRRRSRTDTCILAGERRP